MQRIGELASVPGTEATWRIRFLREDGPTYAARAKAATASLAWGGQHRASSEVGVAPGKQRKNKSPAGDRAALPPDRRRESMIGESNPGSRPARLRLANLTPGYHLPSLRDSTTTAVYQHQRSNSFRDPGNAGRLFLLFVQSDRVALGDYSPRAPTDPYVPALEHTVPQITASLRA